jgi:hypothetical protein
MRDSSILLEETRRTIDKQVEEIRSQRTQALKVLRIYFAVAAILIAALSTLLTTSVGPPFQIEFEDGLIKTSLIVSIGIMVAGRGIFNFYRGIYSTFDVLSFESVPNHYTIKQIVDIISMIRGEETSERDRYPTRLGPNIDGLSETGETAQELIERNRTCIEINQETIEANNEYLWNVYRRMAGGMTNFGVGILIMMFAI